MHRLFANIKKFVYLCTTFSVENDGCCSWQHGHTDYSNKTNLIRRNLASFMNRKKLANVSTHLCTTFAVFAIRAMREPLRTYGKSSIFCVYLYESLNAC